VHINCEPKQNVTIGVIGGWSPTSWPLRGWIDPVSKDLDIIQAIVYYIRVGLVELI
jgi:hypothetical protein